MADVVIPTYAIDQEALVAHNGRSDGDDLSMEGWIRALLDAAVVNTLMAKRRSGQDTRDRTERTRIARALRGQ